MQGHAGHRLQALKSVGEKCFSLGRPLDPMRVGYTEVTNGEDFFVIRSSRKSIEEPLHFELIRGRLRVIRAALEIQEEEIRKEMKYHFPWTSTERLSGQRIELFIRLFKELAAGLNPQEITVCGHAYADSSAAYGLLETHLIEALMQKCLARFLPEELTGIRRFIEAHKGGDGVMALLIKQHCKVEQAGD